jgi:uncharacterized membrane protein YbhN (UPF0104 family)
MKNKAKKNWSWLLRTLPWVVALGLLVFLFKKIPPQELWSSYHRVSLVPFLLFAIVYFLAVGLLDTYGLSRVLSKFCNPIHLGELWPGRCVSYLISLVNYNAGQVGLAGYLKRKKDFSFFKSLGSIFFVTATDLYWIVFLAFLGSFFVDFQFEGFSLSLWTQRIGYIAFLALLLHLAFWNRWFYKILPFKFHFAFADWIRGRHLFQAFHHAKLKDYLLTALRRLPLHLIFISSMWVLVRLFGGTITWRDTFATVPIIFLLGALPITPGGLGAVQIATVELLKDKVVGPHPEEMLFALSLAWMGTNYLLKVLFGLIYFRAARSDAMHQEPESAPS